MKRTFTLNFILTLLLGGAGCGFAFAQGQTIGGGDFPH